MFHKKGLALVAACATLAFGGLVRAADGGSSSNQPVLLDDTTTAPAVAPPAAAAAPVPRPLTGLLNATPLGTPMGNANIAITGFVEGSTTFIDHTAPSVGGNGNNIFGRTFDTEADSPLLDQLDLAITKSVDDTQKKFDVGFVVEQMYGADMAYIHSNGLTTYSPSKIDGAYFSSGTRQPKDQYDLTQANLTFALPIGNGALITVGKFITPLGAEVIDAPGNALYSHSFLFGQLPFTQTGVTVAYNVTSELTATLGTTRGWDQALKDTNGDMDLLASVAYTSDDKKWTHILNISSGNQSADLTGTDGWRTVIDYTGSYQYSDNLKLTLNADYGWQKQGVVGGGNSQWYGIATYAAYTVCDYVTVNGRAEWFNDPNGASPGTYDAGVSNTYYEATLGLSITPIPHNNIGKNLVLRPEVRDDYANNAAWGDPTAKTHNQATLALEGYFAF